MVRGAFKLAFRVDWLFDVPSNRQRGLEAFSRLSEWLTTGLIVMHLAYCSLCASKGEVGDVKLVVHSVPETACKSWVVRPLIWMLGK